MGATVRRMKRRRWTTVNLWMTVTSFSQTQVGCALSTFPDISRQMYGSYYRFVLCDFQMMIWRVMTRWYREGGRQEGSVTSVVTLHKQSFHLCFPHLQCFTLCPFSVSIFLFQWNKRNEKGETSLHRACIDGNLKQVQYLVEQVRKNNIYLIFILFYFLITAYFRWRRKTESGHKTQ